VGGVGVDALAQFFQDFNGVQQFGGGGCQHKSEGKAARTPAIHPAAFQ
jgi:hypothetical protein